jgi:hypothetical protein
MKKSTPLPRPVFRPFSWRALRVGIFMALGLSGLVAALAEDHSAPDNFRAGFAQVDITPPVGLIITGPKLPISKGTDDPLRARVVVVQNGKRKLAVVGIDLVKVRHDIADAAIALVLKQTDITRDAVLICPSHNHSSPFIPEGGPNNKEYIATLPGLLARGIIAADKALQPARLSIGRSLVLEGHHNRRLISKADGLALNTWLTKLNDLKQVPQVLGTEGPIDPELWVARFDTPDGKPLGALVNFTCHPAFHDRSGLMKWSADFPGVIADYVTESLGNGAVCVFTQGASGNIAPPVQFTPDWRERSMVFARAALAAANSAFPIEGPVPVDYLRRDVEVPRADPSKQRDEAISRLGWRPEAFAAAKAEASKGSPTRSVPVSAARIGPFAIATNGGELFVEWGISIKQRSPFPYTVLSELTNDWVGYEPTRQAFAHEGYETLAGVDFISADGIQTLVDTSVDLLNELWKRSPKPR